MNAMSPKSKVQSPKSGKVNPMPSGFARDPGGMVENSPTFQRWGSHRQTVQVPKGRLNPSAKSAVPSGLIADVAGVPNVKTLGYSRLSLRDNDFTATYRHPVPTLDFGLWTLDSSSIL